MVTTLQAWRNALDHARLAGVGSFSLAKKHRPAHPYTPPCAAPAAEKYGELDRLMAKNRWLSDNERSNAR